MNTPDTPVILTVNGLSKTYRTDTNETVNALSDVNLTVTAGQFITMIGPTGCGKTSLLNIIAGMLTHDDGTVTIDPSLKVGRTMGCVFQNYHLFPWLNTVDNVAFGLKMRGLNKRSRNERARQLLEEVGLTGFEGSYPHELSGGMRQRVAIAQTLAIKPRLLLMDEPFGALDDRTRMDVQAMLVKIWEKHKITILFVTHNLDEAVLLGSRIIAFSDRPGRILADIPVDLDRPRERLGDDFSELVMTLRRQLHGAPVWPTRTPARIWTPACQMMPGTAGCRSWQPTVPA